MRLAFFGDVIGRSGREGLVTHLPGLRRRLQLDFVVVNAENAAAGFGITAKTAEELFDAGADCLTLGNHSWDQREALTYIDREPRLLRPLNYPRLSHAPGRGAWMFDAPGGRRVLVMNALGRVHMDSLDDPFSAVDSQLEACPLGVGADAIIVDMHCEATSEKMAMGISATGGRAWWWAPTPMSPPPMRRCCRAARLIKPTPAPAATTTASSAWRRRKLCAASPPACRAGDTSRPRARRRSAASMWRPTR